MHPCKELIGCLVNCDLKLTSIEPNKSELAPVESDLQPYTVCNDLYVFQKVTWKGGGGPSGALFMVICVPILQRPYTEHVYSCDVFAAENSLTRHFCH